MGVFIDYDLIAECDDEELVRRLEAVRQRCLDLSLKSVGKVRRVAPVYNRMNLTLLEGEGHELPTAIKRRIEATENDSDHSELCISFALLAGANLPHDLQVKYLAPAMELIESTDLWKRDDLPEKVGISAFGFTSYSISRFGLELEFANILLRHGYVLMIHPGEGSETVSLGLSSYAKMEGSRITDPPLWHGKSFTKTQYAKDFIQVHETVCRVLDIVKEEGLLLSAGDTCGYYKDRNWKKAGKQVNEELAFAKLAGDLMGLGIGNLREEGVPITVVVDNASKAKQVDFSSRLQQESEE